jgi:putative thymidine phosphorylase
MELKIKILRWSAGVPVVMLSKETAKKIGVSTNERISLKKTSKNTKEIFTLVDIIDGLCKENEIGISEELRESYKLKRGQIIEVNIAPTPDSLFFVKKKLLGKRLEKKEIFSIINDIVNNSSSEAEIALFISAMYNQGISMKEIIYLIEAILDSGNRLRFKNKFVVDKHSIGGIAGNRTTPILVAICASAGLIIPKSSSRAITSPAGTADVVETIANVEFSIKDLKKIVSKTNGCLVWGGSLGMVPADSKIIHIEKMLKIDPESQLLASIMAKKLAGGSNYILIDIPYGDNAKVDLSRAKKLKRKFEYLGRHFKKKLKVVLTRADEPMGSGVGPALELIDVIKVLDPLLKGPRDLEEKSLLLAGAIFEMTGKAKKGKGIKLAQNFLDSGKAFEKFKEIIKEQGGEIIYLKPGKFKKDIFAKKSGMIVEINNKKINSLACSSGCPAYKFAGLYLYFNKGDLVKKGEKIMTIYAESKMRLAMAIKDYKKNNPVIIK